MMATMPQQVRSVSPNHRFKKIGSEEVHTVEAYERTIHGTPYSDPKREFSTNQYTERRTYGRDENGEIVVKIEKDPSEPVRPVSPVRPVTPVGGRNFDEDHLLKPLSLLDTTPLHIPRPKSTPSPRSTLETPSFGHSPRSGRSSGFGSAGTPQRALSPAGSNVSGGAAIPMKKVIRKSRLVSIHDGRPVSPFVETVTYEPAIQMPPPRTTVFKESDEYGSDEYNDRRQNRNYERSSLGNRSLHYTDDMETIPLHLQRTSRNAPRSDFYDRDESFYGTAGSAHRYRLNNLRHEVTRTHSDPVSYSRRRSQSTTAAFRPQRERKNRNDGAIIINNPLYRDY
ncbi:hypothetical protein FO519_003808 [Halicephalobus sp. NKZ332]|nr:hypothetical protein FO519_003808 [Halicephalobus sp. NKZ332]